MHIVFFSRHTVYECYNPVLPSFEKLCVEYGKENKKHQVASYLFEKFKAGFHSITYHRIYRYDSLVVFKGKKIAREIKDWLE